MIGGYGLAAMVWRLGLGALSVLSHRGTPGRIPKRNAAKHVIIRAAKLVGSETILTLSPP